MSVQKRPYELSVWNEELIGEGKKAETKMLIIGADTMTYDGRATGIKLVRKVNGTNTLTFQMLDSFFDSKKGEFVKNDYIDELFAERKIKLYYKKKWYEFYIKNVKEDKKHNSVLKTFTCEDAFIDELARNGYGITFDEELYNNVEEIGTFTEEILEDSIWEYAPEYNWGDFTEYSEEKLFKINTNNFKDGIIHAYKLEYYYDDFEGQIENTNTKETRNIELGDDLSRVKGYYWDQYNNTDSASHKLKSTLVELNIADYPYIYIPYSSLSFCYTNCKSDDLDKKPDRTATEEPAYDEVNGNYYVAPAEVNPNTLIQFIAFTSTDVLEIDETGLIVNKDCHYIMTLEEWNSMNTNQWYIFNDIRYVETNNGNEEDSYEMSYNFKYILESNEDQFDKGNKCITYEGYLSNLKNNEIIKGKKISIADRTEMNISEDIDSFVTVYNQKSDDEELKEYYSNMDWKGDFSNYRICSRSSTRQILPTLAKNYIQNGTNIEGTTGWEAMKATPGDTFIEPTISYRTSDDENHNVVETYLSFLTGEDTDTVPSVDKYSTLEDIKNSGYKWIRCRIPMEFPDFEPRQEYYYNGSIHEPYWDSPYSCLTSHVRPIFERISYDFWKDKRYYGKSYIPGHSDFEDFPSRNLAVFPDSEGWTDEKYNKYIRDYLSDHYNGRIVGSDGSTSQIMYGELFSNFDQNMNQFDKEQSALEWALGSLQIYKIEQNISYSSPYVKGDISEFSQAIAYITNKSDTFLYQLLKIKDYSTLTQWENDDYYKVLCKIEGLAYSPSVHNAIQLQIHAGAQLINYIWKDSYSSDVSSNDYYHSIRQGTIRTYLPINPNDTSISDYTSNDLWKKGYDLPVVGIGGQVKPPNSASGVHYDYIDYKTEFIYLFLQKVIKNDKIYFNFYIRRPEYDTENNMVSIKYIPTHINVPGDLAAEVIEIMEGYCSAKAKLGISLPDNTPFIYYSRFVNRPKLVDDNGNLIEIDKDNNGTITFDTVQDNYNTGGAAKIYLERKEWTLEDDLNLINNCSGIDPYGENKNGKITISIYSSPEKATTFESPMYNNSEEIEPTPEDDKSAKHTILNFGAISQEKTIKKDQVYCLGLKVKIKEKQHKSSSDIPFTIKIAEGYLKSTGAYELHKDKQISFKLQDFYPSDILDYDEITTNLQPWKTLYTNSKNKEFNEKDLDLEGMFSDLITKYILFKTDLDIENPYIAITSSYDYLLSDIELFEAYTKGQDYFKNSYYQLSGRDFYFPRTINNDMPKREIHIYPERHLSIYWSEILTKEVLFEQDIMAGTTYEYQKYFIQQLQLSDNTNYDTFMCKSYLSEKGSTNSLPLDSSIYDEDNFKIITNIIDLTKCQHYLYESQGCNFNNKICYYQKYGYCPYLFTSEKHCRKIRTLKGEKSNRFNLTQELSKVFKCYPVYYIAHEQNGIIKKDEDECMIKKVYFITEKGKTSIYGFRYGKNLSNIGRNIVSNQIVTKLYVNDVDSEYSKTGLCSIKTAPDNPSKDSFIIDFSYYTTKGLLPVEQIEQDLYGIKYDKTVINGYLKTLGNYNTQYDILTNKIINLQNNSFNDIDAHIQINIEGINVIIKEIKEYTEMISKYSNQQNSSIYKTYQAKLREAQSTLYNLLSSTFEPIKNDEKIIDLLAWFAEETADESFEDIIKKYKDEHNWKTGLLGQYNNEYLQIQNWKKERARYLKLANNLTASFFKKYEPYLKEGTWSDTNYLTDNAYYYGALEVSAQGAIPKIEYSISVLDLSPFEGYYDYELDNGDVTYIEDISILGYNKNTGFPNRLKVMVSEISEDLDIPTNNSIKVQNFTTQFEDLFQQVTATVQNLTLNENIYRRASNFTSTHSIQEDSLQDTLNNNNFTLVNNAQKNVVMDQKGQSGANINNRTSQYKLTGQGLYFSKDGGISWKKGITPDQKTDLDIKSSSVETEKIDLIGSDNKAGSSITSYGVECYNGTNDSFVYDTNGLAYNSNDVQLLQAGILSQGISTTDYGFLLHNGERAIFKAATSLDNNTVNRFEVNSDTNFVGKNTFNNGNYSFIIGGTPDENTNTTKIRNNVSYQLRLFSVVLNNQNIFTILANGTAIMGGTITTYSSEYTDYILITGGHTVQTNT